MDENLLGSLRKQHNVDFEFIPIDYTKMRFNSIPSALNYGGQKATGDYIMFVHQDVYLCGCCWLNKALTLLGRLSKVGAVGIAGIDSIGNQIGFILDRGRYWGRFFQKPTKVQTLDEQLVIVPRLIFESLKFDERFDFHSYVADYSLSVQNLGLNVYVIPLVVEHNSMTVPVFDASSIEIQDEILYRKHRKYHKSINKTTGNIGKKRDLLKKKIGSLYSDFTFTMTSTIFKLWKISMHEKIILDLGCIPMEQHALKTHLARKNYTIGVSLKRRYLVTSNKLDVHNEYIIADPEKLPFKLKSIDMTILTGLLEYESKSTGKRIISESERTTKEIVVKVPCSGSPIDTTHVVFRSFWKTSDFKKSHYKTFSIGFKHPFFPCILLAYKTTLSDASSLES